MDRMRMLPRDHHPAVKEYTSTPSPPSLASPGGVGVFLRNRTGPANFYHPETIPPSDPEFIKTSSFVPKEPTNLKIEEHLEDTIVLSWDESACTTLYVVRVKGPSGVIEQYAVNENRVVITDFDACSTYDVFVTAEAYGRSKDEPLHLKIEPSVVSAENLDLEMSATINSVTSKWASTIPCVDAYKVTLCTHGICRESVTVDNNVPGFEFTDLEPCSAYNVSVKPVVGGKHLWEKVFTFETISPPADEVKLLPVTAVAGEGEMMTIAWTPVTCASSYQVFHWDSLDGFYWDHIETSAGSEVSFVEVPCTEYKYGVTVTVDGIESEIVEAVKTPMDRPHDVVNLTIKPSTESVELSLKHAKCIESFRIIVCKAGSAEEDCPTIDGPGTQNLTEKIENLSPCTNYFVQVFVATNGKEQKQETKHFSTLATEPTAPGNFSINQNPKGNKIDISIDKVGCASGYKVYQRLDDSEQDVIHETKESSLSFDCPGKCDKLRFAVSAVVNGEEGPISEFYGVKDREESNLGCIIYLFIAVVTVLVLSAAVNAFPLVLKYVKKKKDTVAEVYVEMLNISSK